MTYCAKCGVKNQDGVAFCESCGNNLNVRSRQRSQNYDNMCFGKKEGNNQFGWIIFGAIVLIGGLGLFLDQTFDIQVDFWPLIVMIVGVLIIISAVLNQRYINRQS